MVESNPLVAIAPHTMGDALIFDSSFAQYSPTSASSPPDHNELGINQTRNTLSSIQTEPLIEDSQEGIIETPNTSPDNEAISPKQPIRRTSGRRPLSLISNSSITSNPELYPNADFRSPEPVSPGKHRRHRSVIGTSVDYRTYYPYTHSAPILPGVANGVFPPQSANVPGRNNSLHLNSQNSHFQHQHPQYNPYQPSQLPIHSSNTSPETSTHQYLSSPPITHNGLHINFTPNQSPMLGAPLGFDNSEMCGLDNVFVILAYKERQVLEAKQTLDQAREDLDNFRRQMTVMLQPDVMTVQAPLKPSIISRRQRIGLNSVKLLPVLARDRHDIPPSVVQWQIDNDIENSLRDSIVLDASHTLKNKDTLALSVIKCLLGVVRLFISTLPLHQQHFHYEQTNRRVIVGWKPQYPLPMDSMYSHFLYEA